MFKSLISNLGLQQRAVQSIGNGESAYISTLQRSTAPTFENDRDFLQTYIDAVWVYASVSAVAEAAAQVPFKIFDMRNREKPREVTYDEKFKFFRFPNMQMSQYRLFEAMFSFLRLTGDVYLEMQPNVYAPEKMYILRPDLMEMELDSRIGVKRYLYWPNGKNSSDKPTYFAPEEVVHIKTFNPLHQFQGLSPLHASQLSIASDLLSQKYNIKFFENGASPFGIFHTDTVLNPDKLNFIEEKIIKFMQKSKNWFSPLILHGGLKYQAVSLGPKDVEFGSGRELNRTDILSSQRATPAVLGLSTANYSEAKEQSRIFRQYRVLPMLRAMQSDIDNLILQFLGPNLQSQFDYTSLPEYQEDVVENELRLRTEYDRGIITLNEYRHALRLPPEKDKLGNKRFILTALSELDENGVILAQPSTPSSPESPDKIDDDEKKAYDLEQYYKLNDELLSILKR